MEFFLFLGLAFVGAVFYLWRSRAGTSRGPESLIQGLPDDLRDKDVGTPKGAGGGTGGIGGTGGWG